MIEAGLVIEPLKDLYKDEVRLLGEELGLPHALVWRHPFPGPGLGVRILCAMTPESEIPYDASLLEGIDHVVLPIKTVGVQGDGRTYRHALAVFRDQPSMSDPVVQDLATTIPNTIPVFNRVVLCTSHSVHVPFVFMPGAITRERADVLRDADSIVDDVMREHDLYQAIWQFPVVLLPFGTASGKQSIVLRPVSSIDAMTAHASPLPDEALRAMTERILKEIPGIDCVFVDMHK